MPKGHRVLVTNPDGERIVLRGKAKYFVIIPVQEDLFEVHYGGKYLGESDSLSGAEKFIQRGGASAPVLIKNPNGGYEMYKHKYKAPSKAKSNPKKKSKKKASKKRSSTKKKSTKKKSTKKKSTKKKSTKKRSSTKKRATKKRSSTKKRATKKRSTAKKRTSSGKKRKSTKKTTSKKSEPKKKVSVDAAVRNHIAKQSGKRPNW